MNSFEQFREELRDTLTHLHRPDYQPSALLRQVLGCDSVSGAASVQSTVIDLIKSLEPSPNIPTDARNRRDFELLHQRFVLGLTQEETADRMGIGVRSVRRAQREATHRLARVFWEHSLARQAAAGTTDDQQSAGQAEDWREQVAQDLASLRMSAPGAVADVAETVERAVHLESALTSQYGCSLRVGQVEPGLVAAMHPAALRQILIMALGQLARCATAPGEIRIEARREGNSVVIDVQAPRQVVTDLPDRELIDEILSSQAGSLEVRVDQEGVGLCLKVPYTGRVTVLVVDDNPDMVHFYRVCVSGTRYHVLHAPHGQRTVEHIETVAPDLIVLDIILPDIDGWELLERLRDHPPTRAIPVIVCSIVREDGLAAALGAVSYLPKPIRCPEFLQALDTASDRASAARSRS